MARTPLVIALAGLAGCGWLGNEPDAVPPRPEPPPHQICALADGSLVQNTTVVPLEVTVPEARDSFPTELPRRPRCDGWT